MSLPSASPFPRLADIGERLNKYRATVLEYQAMTDDAKAVTLHTMPAGDFLELYRDIMFLLTALDAQGSTIGILGRIAKRAAAVVERCDSENLAKLERAMKDPEADKVIGDAPEANA